jgi:indolepyruvate ferredoxin oxidoreductase
MTGGQPNEGGLTAPQIARELQAMGVKPVVAVYDEKEDVDRSQFPGLRFEDRATMLAVQKELEERRPASAPSSISRPAPPKSAAAASAASSPTRIAASGSTPRSARAAAIAACSRTASRSCPRTPNWAASAQIDQSSCNKDYSCVNGFCPSFVSVKGGKLKKPKAAALDLPDPARARAARHSGHL